jgi:hypothetical protein
MDNARTKFGVAVLVAWAAMMTACAGGAGHETSGRSEDSLTLAATPPPPQRRIIRATNPGCAAIAGLGGTWNGAGITGPMGTTTTFCTYTWAPAGKNAAPDETAFAGFAAPNTKLYKKNQPYVVRDVRASNTALSAGSLIGPGTIFTHGGGSSSGGAIAFAGANTFTTSGGNAQLGGGNGTLIGTKPIPGGGTGCDVCVGEFPEYDDSLLVVVLPPEALEYETIELRSEDDPDLFYPVEPASEPYFYVWLPPFTPASSWYVMWQ